MDDGFPALFMFEKNFSFFTFCPGTSSAGIYEIESLLISKLPYNATQS